MRRALLVALALAACKSEPPAPAAPPPPAVVRQLSVLGVVDATPADRKPAPIADAALRAALEKALLAQGLVRGKDKAGWRVQVDARVVYGVALDDGIAATPVAGPARIVWDAEVRIRPPNESAALGDFLTGRSEAPFAGDAAALPGVLATVLAPSAEALAERVGALVDAYTTPVAGLTAQLEDPRPARRLAAASRLGMLRDATAVPALVARLPVERDRDVLLRIVGALTELGDPRAAEALIALADPKDRELLQAVVDALSAVGGARAGDFLDILGSHDAPDVREMVETARARIERREARDKP